MPRKNRNSKRINRKSRKLLEVRSGGSYKNLEKYGFPTPQVQHTINKKLLLDNPNTKRLALKVAKAKKRQTLMRNARKKGTPLPIMPLGYEDRRHSNQSIIAIPKVPNNPLPINPIKQSTRIIYKDIQTQINIYFDYINRAKEMYKYNEKTSSGNKNYVSAICSTISVTEANAYVEARKCLNKKLFTHIIKLDDVDLNNLFQDIVNLTSRAISWKKSINKLKTYVDDKLT